MKVTFLLLTLTLFSFNYQPQEPPGIRDKPCTCITLADFSFVQTSYAMPEADAATGDTMSVAPPGHPEQADTVVQTPLDLPLPPPGGPKNWPWTYWLMLVGFVYEVLIRFIPTIADYTITGRAYAILTAIIGNKHKQGGSFKIKKE